MRILSQFKKHAKDTWKNESPLEHTLRVRLWSKPPRLSSVFPWSWAKNRFLVNQRFRLVTATLYFTLCSFFPHRKNGCGGSILACRVWSHPVWWGKCISWCSSATPLRDNQTILWCTWARDPSSRLLFGTWNVSPVRVLWLVYVSTWPKFSKIEPFSWIFFFNSTDWKHPPFFGHQAPKMQPPRYGQHRSSRAEKLLQLPGGAQYLLLRPWSWLALGPHFRPESYPSIFSIVSLYFLSRFLVSATQKVLNTMAHFWLNDC